MSIAAAFPFRALPSDAPCPRRALVNNDHLVAWNCQYNVEKIQAGGLLSTLQTDEGAVCRCVPPSPPPSLPVARAVRDKD